MSNIKQYNCNSNAQLSQHFNVSEFKCKCGGSHNIINDSDLINMLEKLYTGLNCSRIIITSGHRCSYYDKKVGGSGRGKHVDGMAADIICYDMLNKIINSKLVCCKAQDLGFGGIARISDTATHLDTRTGSRYLGDETVSLNTVTNDFYKYFGIEKETRYDVMNDNTVSDWAKVPVQQIIDAGIMKGYDSGYFGGKDALTREQFCRVLVNMRDKGIIKF